MDKNKAVATGILAAVMAVSGQFVQVGNLTADTSCVGMQSAEAFGFGDVKSLVGNVVKQAFDVNVTTLNAKRQDMFVNLSRAAQMEAYSQINLGQALGLNPSEFSAENDALYSLQHGSALDTKLIKQVSSNFSAEDAKSWSAKADAAISDKSRLQSEDFRNLVKASSNARSAAAMYNALAFRDAAMMIAQTSKAMAAGNLGDKADAVANILSAAKGAQTLLNEQKAHSKMLHEISAKIEKATNIKPASKKEIEETGAKLTVKE